MLQIVINQSGKTAGVNGRAREDLDTGTAISVAAVGGPFLAYSWTFLSKAINIVAGVRATSLFATPNASSSLINPIDQPGTYLVQLAVDSGSGLGATEDDVVSITFYAGPALNADPTQLPRRIPAFGERRQHNVPDAIDPLGNVEGWSREWLRWFAYIKNLIALVVPFSEISPPALSASVNDYAPTGLPAAAVIRLGATATWSVTGLNVAGWTVKQKVLINTSTFPILIPNQSASSSAANRFLNESGGDFVLAPNALVWNYLDSTTGSIRVANSLRSAPIAIGNSGAAKTVDFTKSPAQSITIDQNTTLTFIVPSVDLSIVSLVLKFSGGAHTVAYAVTGGSMLSAGGVPPVLDTTGKNQTLCFQRMGTDLQLQATPPFS